MSSWVNSNTNSYITGILITLILIIHWINQVSIGINIGYIINLYQDWLLLIILVSILVIVIFCHPVQALVQIYIIADITGCKKDTKTVSYLLYYLFPIHPQINRTRILKMNKKGCSCWKKKKSIILLIHSGCVPTNQISVQNHLHLLLF